MERGGKRNVQIVYGLVESLSNSEENERRREVVNRLVEILRQPQGSQALG